MGVVESDASGPNNDNSQQEEVTCETSKKHPVAFIEFRRRDLNDSNELMGYVRDSRR